MTFLERSDAATIAEATVAENLLVVRSERHLSQAEVARRIGVSTPQFRKYETGTNRISAEMLVRLAVELDVDIARFFQGLPFAKLHKRENIDRLAVEEAALDITSISDAGVRKAFLELLDKIDGSNGSTDKES